MFGDKPENFIEVIVFNGAWGELNFVWHLLKAEFSLERLKEATLLLILFLDVLDLLLICRVLVLLLRGFTHLANLLDLIRHFSLNLQGIFGETEVLLVAGDKDWYLPVNDINIAEQIVKDLGRLAIFGLVLGIKKENDGSGTTGFDQDVLAEVKVAWHVNQLGLNLHEGSSSRWFRLSDCL